MNFTKMNGLGNDYIFFDGIHNKISLTKKDIIELCNRNFGIGGDGIVIVSESVICDYKMIIYNADGTRAEMCGNALRCLAEYVNKNYLSDKVNLKIETDAGTRYTRLLENGCVEANMGNLLSSPQLIKINNNIMGYYVNVGNPHFVVFCDEIDELFNLYAHDLSENTFYFPDRTNVEFVNIDSEKNCAKMRVYERGVGETLACGTGATAVFGTAFYNKWMRDNALIILKGGILKLSHNDEHDVLVTGDVKINFEGNIDLNDGE